MRKSLFSIAAAALLVASAGMAHAQSSTTTTTTWSNDEGPGLREYSTTRHYDTYQEPSWHAEVGAELPGNATMYPLPDTMHVPSADRYSYSIINNQPVVVERTTRKVVHTWD
jgi:ABC-type glycerol-3-phosphate transport system substrate-binding protein